MPEIQKRSRGRPKGAVNKVTADIKAAASVYSEAALKALATIMAKGESEAARVAAANSILDRAHGKPKQAIVGGDDDDAPVVLAVIERRIVYPQ